MVEFDAKQIRDLKHYDEEKETHTDEPAPLKEKFDMLLDMIDSMDVELHNTVVELEEFKKKWMNHRHSVGQGLYSGKAER